MAVPRRLQELHRRLEQPDDLKLTQIINDEISRHSLRISPDALREVIELPRTFMPYKAFPGKVIEIINRLIESGGPDHPADHAISVGDITRTFCKMTGEPDFIVNPAIRLDLDQTRKYFSERVLGQDPAVDAVISAVMTFKARLSDERRPIRSFLFVGPTGVGKTELAKVLADYLFGSREKMIKLNMSEYNDYNSVARLIGTPHGKQSAFLSQVHKFPFAVVLLDEVEKSHPDVLNLLLQLLDEGIIYDADGKPAYFQTIIVIMTSNIGSRQLKDFGQGVGFTTTAKQASSAEYSRSVIENALKKSFAPEFLNRIDDVVIFNALEREDIHKIIDIELSQLYDRIKALGYKIVITGEAKDFIAEKGWDSQFGARPLKRAIQKYVEDVLAEEIIKTKILPDDTITVNYSPEKEDMVVTITSHEKKSPPKQPVEG